ncbi:MAG: hypothetical protein NZM29_05655, partial [Nitrospira sp.]|nr:hypothetical protein [Nitrospira sp.]
MGIILVAQLVASIPGSTHAEWAMLDQRYQDCGLRTVYIDPQSITRGEHDLGAVSVLTDWAVMQGGRSPTRFFSTIVRKEVDCPNKLVRLATFADYFGHMGTGKQIAGGKGTGSWHPVEA